jgi:thiol-disulfide isomerase/thioredoxin
LPGDEVGAYQGDDLLGGREARFSEVFQRGKPVVLNFWAGNCPPCRFEMPSFQAVADKYDGEVVFVGVDVGLLTGLGDHESARQLLDELDVRYPSAYALDASALQQYKVVTMPTTIFFDSQGGVVARRAGIVLEDELSDIVDQLAAGS